jgi:hypothetical protein
MRPAEVPVVHLNKRLQSVDVSQVTSNFPLQRAFCVEQAERAIFSLLVHSAICVSCASGWSPIAIQSRLLEGVPLPTSLVLLPPASPVLLPMNSVTTLSTLRNPVESDH